MASKNIAVREDLYNRLDEIKEKDESFSDVIERLLDEGQKGSMGWIKKYLGVWNDMPEEFFDVINNARTKFDEEMDARLMKIRNS